MLRRLGLAVALTLSLFSVATAQPVGTFRWQTAPFCNVLTLAVTANGPTFRLEGTDDQCGSAVQASAIGIAFANVDGSIGIGLTIVATPGGAPVHLDATISTAAGFSGTWRDNAARTGAFVFTAGAGAGGSPRPLVAQTQYGTVLAQPTGAADRGLSAVVTTDTGSTPNDAAGLYGRFGVGSALASPASAGVHGDSTANVGVLGLTETGVGVAGGANIGIGVQGYASGGAPSIGIQAKHLGGGTAFEINNGSIKVAGTVRSAFTHTELGVGSCSWIDHPLTNGDPNALVFVTSRNPISVYVLVPSIPGPPNWYMCTTNGAPITGYTFNVLVIKQ